MFKIEIVKKANEFSAEITREDFVDFLYDHLDDFGDPKSAINASIDYAFSEANGKGGFLLCALEDEKMVGALVMNFTGMVDYVPENMLVYIAVDASCRGKGFGTKIIKKAREICQGDITLHVEYDNPAKRLYERLGFENKYAEMRLKS